MTTCPCGFTLQPHQKFCPNCGAKVTHDEAPTLYPQYQTPPAASDPTTYTQYAPSAASGNITPPGTSRCPHCGGDVNANAPFCMHCGTPLAAATPQTAPTSAPANCPNCGSAVNPNAPFCSMCGAHVTGQATAAPAVMACPNCGQATNGNTPFCMHCGARLQGTGAPATAPGMQRPTTCTQCGYPLQAGAAFCSHCGMHFGPPVQPGTQPGMQQPMMGMPQQVMRCPTCMGAVPVGTAFCTQCGTSMAGVPAPAGVQGQPGFFQNLMSSNAGKIGLGVAGGVAAAVIGEALIHDLEGGGMGYDEFGNPFRRHHRGLMGEIIRDVL